jgi:hypothetical protein
VSCWEFSEGNSGKLPTDRPVGLQESTAASAMKTYIVNTTRKRAFPLIIWS